MKKNNIDKDTKLGIALYSLYFILRPIIFIYNLFILYRLFNGNSTFTILTILLNIIYILLYNSNKILLSVILCIILCIFLNDISKSICFSLIIYNGIEFLIYLIYYIINSIIFKIIHLGSKFK